MELHEIDLNLLVVFDRLLKERRVSRVAEQLGVSQPAVSNALAKLRRALGDELFLRTPRGMAPTPFAERLAGPVTVALATIRDGLSQRASFDPATAARTFTVGMTDIGEICFLPSLLERLRRDAPHVAISTVRNAAVDLREELESGKVDLAIGLLPQLRTGFFQRRLFSQRYVCLMRRGHRLARRRPTLADYLAAEHLKVVSAGTGHGRIDALLERYEAPRTVRMTVPHFVSVGHLLQESDLVATVPERLAERLAGPFGLVHVPHPAPLPEVPINVFWHAKYQREPANRWLRGLILELFGGQGAGQRPVTPP